MVGAGGWKMGYCLMSTEFQFLKMKRALEVAGGDDTTTLCV